MRRGYQLSVLSMTSGLKKPLGGSQILCLPQPDQLTQLDCSGCGLKLGQNLGTGLGDKNSMLEMGR